MSVEFPIYRAVAPTHPEEQHQGTQLSGISRGDFVLLKLFSDMIPCYQHYHVGICRQVGAKAPRVETDN